MKIKNLVFGALAITMAFALTACGGTSETKDKNTNSKQTTKEDDTKKTTRSKSEKTPKEKAQDKINELIAADGLEITIFDGEETNVIGAKGDIYWMIEDGETGTAINNKTLTVYDYNNGNFIFNYQIDKPQNVSALFGDLTLGVGDDYSTYSKSEAKYANRKCDLYTKTLPSMSTKYAFDNETGFCLYYLFTMDVEGEGTTLSIEIKNLSTNPNVPELIEPPFINSPLFEEWNTSSGQATISKWDDSVLDSNLFPAKIEDAHDCQTRILFYNAGDIFGEDESDKLFIDYYLCYSFDSTDAINYYADLKSFYENAGFVLDIVDEGPDSYEFTGTKDGYYVSLFMYDFEQIIEVEIDLYVK